MEQVSTPRPADKNLPAYRYAKALSLAARGAAEPKIKVFKDQWDKLTGRYQWVNPASKAARQLADGQFQGVCNWTYATVKTKAAMILKAQSEVTVEPLDDVSTYYDRLLVKSAVQHLLESVRFKDIKRDVYMSGAVTGIGIAMWRYRPDSLTGSMKLEAIPIKSDEFFRDPSADCITSPDCRFVVWEPEQDMSVIREVFPSKVADVKPESKRVGNASGMTYSTANDANLIYGAGGDYSVTEKNTLNSRKARVCYVWIRDESLVEDLQVSIIKEAETGFMCEDCGQKYAADAIIDEYCPDCGSTLVQGEITPAETEQSRVIRKAYPYGRLIVYSGDTLLFDGQNPCELEGVFPFAVYHHDRIPGDFYGVNDVSLLDSLQDAQNRTIGEIIDGMRLSFHGIFIYPVSAKSFTDMGISPAERHPVPDHLVDKPRFAAPQSNVQIASIALAAIKEQFVIVGGLGGPALGEVSSPPISATEAEISNARLSDRLRGHAEEFSTFCSDFAEIGRQLAVQFYQGEQVVPVQFPDSTQKDVHIEWQSLPNVRVKVEITPEASVRDKQIGQNITTGMQTGILDSPYAELYLSTLGVPPNQIREVMSKKALAAELAPPGMAPPGGPPQPPLGLVGGPPDAAINE